MNCEECNNQGWYEVTNHRTETIEHIQCMNCLLHEQFKETLTLELAKLFTSASPQKICEILATLCVNNVDRNENDNLERLDKFIQAKDLISLLTMASVYAQ